LAPARWFFDNAELESGLRLRRVTLKVSLPRYLSFFYGPRNSRWARPRGPRQSPPGRSFARPAGLYLDPMPKAYFIQWARNTARRDAVLAQFQKEFDRDLSNLENDTQETLSALRERLFWISLVTFAGIVGGSFWLVRLGLSPLQRLSEAVSRVSEKDFRLP